MKLHIKIWMLLLAAGFVAGISGCKKDWLEPQPLSFYEPDETYIDAAAMQAGLVAWVAIGAACSSATGANTKV